ncbi:MAG: hypothetical protein PHC95_12780 [Parabacteroides sp.]|nr:hypothetical protein [Parabacteroides sp.]
MSKEFDPEKESDHSKGSIVVEVKCVGADEALAKIRKALDLAVELDEILRRHS